MQIVGFKKLKDNKYKVFLKNKQEIILYDDVILKFNLLNNKNITSKELENILEYNEELASYYKAIKYLSIKMRTKKELREYLKKNNFSVPVITTTLKRLEKEGYINEKQYVHYFLQDQINLTLNGPLKIKQALLKQNIKEEFINAELDTIDFLVWQNKCQKIINKKLKVNKDSKSVFLNKIKVYLYKEGYSKELYEEQLKEINLNDNDNFFKDANKIYQKLQKKYSGEQLIYYLKSKLYYKGYNTEQINEFINTI